MLSGIKTLYFFYSHSLTLYLQSINACRLTKFMEIKNIYNKKLLVDGSIIIIKYSGGADSLQFRVEGVYI